MDDDMIAAIAALESRVRNTEDRLAIMDLLARYGPAVDSMSADKVVDLWADGGTYELEGYFFTRDTMHQTIETDLHARYVGVGSAHVMSMPQVTLDGDRAVAINYSRVFIREGDRWIVDRTAANRWDLERTAQGWKVRRRINRLANGSAAARALLAGEVPLPA